jgi:hypothetical protein
MLTLEDNEAKIYEAPTPPPRFVIYYRHEDQDSGKAWESWSDNPNDFEGNDGTEVDMPINITGLTLVREESW